MKLTHKIRTIRANTIIIIMSQHKTVENTFTSPRFSIFKLTKVIYGKFLNNISLLVKKHLFRES